MYSKKQNKLHKSLKYILSTKTKFGSPDLWQNLKNLSGGLNLSRGLNIVGYTFNCIKCFKILAGASFKPGFGGFKPRLKFFKFHLGSLKIKINRFTWLKKKPLPLKTKYTVVDDQ